MLKAIYITILFAFLGTMSFCQVYKYRAKEFAFKSQDANERWTKWSAWSDCDILVVINIGKSTFTIYSKEIQEFDIVKFYPKSYDDEGIEVFEMLGVDEDGLRCHIRQRFITSQVYDSQLYIDYSDFMYVYNLISN